MIFYNANPGEPFFPAAALADIAGQDVRLAHDERGFRVVLPDGSDPIAEEGQEPAVAWASYSSDSQPSAATVAAWRPPELPEPEQIPLTDVEIMTPVFIDYRRQATLHMDGLKAQVWSYLKNEQEMDPALATASGVAFCKSGTGIGVQYDDYIKAGGHPDAATDLWARIQEIKAGFAWFDAGVEAIFAAALGQEV